MTKLQNLIITGTAALAIACSSPQTTKPAITADVQIEQKIEQLLQQMTLEEKVGQMTEITIDIITDFTNPNDFTLKESQLDSIIGKYKVGSILNVPLSRAQTPEKWAEAIKVIQDRSMAEIGIPCIYGVDQIHGTTYTAGGTLFPQGINMAASFNTDLVFRAGEITAYESRAACIPWTYAPTMDLGRDPRWARLWESYGEDSHVNAVMGATSVRALQGENSNQIDAYHMAACAKHYMGYGAPHSGKDRTPAYIPYNQLREKFFEPFRHAVKAGVLSIMVNSASINGVPTHADHELLTQWLKTDLNWDGMLVTDWNDINNLFERESIATSKKDAVRIAINAGIDMAMVPYETQFCRDLKELVEEGAVPMERVDDAVRRVLRLKYRLNLFENPYWDIANYNKFGGEEHAKVALQAAEESEVLLKNENNILPLAKGKKILVTGPNAHNMRSLNGGWSYSWQGNIADEFAGKHNTILEALTAKYGANEVSYEAGVSYKTEGAYYEENTHEIDKAVRAAKDVDVIVACIGENSYCETPGNLTDLTLSKNQLDLVKSLAETGKPIILVLNEGRPRLLSEIEPLADAVISVLLPGNFGGDALANLMAGDANFSAKLPYTYPRLINSLTTYDFKVSEQTGTMEGNYNYDAKVDVQWPFGHGLSYTNYKYSNFKANKNNFTATDEITFTVDVTNSGNVDGKEPVLLFSSDIVASNVPDNMRLRAFSKVALKTGETKSISFTIAASELAFVNNHGNWTLEAGEFRMKCNDQYLLINCTETKVWET
ncbi:MAG: glycoside hydrolase family 3 N-terminal domain-containing protein, partial [Mangrovibacterium sp.]